jgi:hypothetical protein
MLLHIRGLVPGHFLNRVHKFDSCRGHFPGSLFGSTLVGGDGGPPPKEK